MSFSRMFVFSRFDQYLSDLAIPDLLMFLRGCESTEASVQNDRLRGLMEAVYVLNPIDPSMPGEYDELNRQRDNNDTMTRLIPLDLV